MTVPGEPRVVGQGVSAKGCGRGPGVVGGAGVTGVTGLEGWVAAVGVVVVSGCSCEWVILVG